MHTPFFLVAGAFLAGSLALALWAWPFWILFGVVLALTLLGVADITQRRHAVLRNFPVIGHFRYLLEKIRPEISQYFIESDLDGRPFHREARSVVYQRAKGDLDTVPFGTQRDVYEVGYEWIDHSLLAHHPTGASPRVRIGGSSSCTQPYDASLLCVSAMSFGALSRQAVEALSRGAAKGGFSLNTGEGGISPYHLAGGCDLVWQIGTGYFGCRAADGNFELESFRRNAGRPEVKMIEVKLSQGAKPGHGGILPAAKVTKEISAIRGVPMGVDVLSPPAHTAFTTPTELLEFLELLRRESGGKPVGIKLCVGQPWEFMALCKAMRRSGLAPDFIAVDGGEGGTGAAPIEFSNRVGSPLFEGLMLVHNSLVGFDLRDRIKLIAAGKITTGFDMARVLAPRRGPVRLGARDDAGPGLHPGPALQLEPLPGRSRDPGSAARGRTGRARQIVAGGPLPPRDGHGVPGDDRSGGIGRPRGAGSAARQPAGFAQRGVLVPRPLPLARARGAALRAGAARLRGGVATGRRRLVPPPRMTPGVWPGPPA